MFNRIKQDKETGEYYVNGQWYDSLSEAEDAIDEYMDQQHSVMESVLDV